MTMPLLSASGLTKLYGGRAGLQGASASRSRKARFSPSSVSPARASRPCSTCCPAVCGPTPEMSANRMRDGEAREIFALSEAERRLLLRTDWGFVHQDAALGLRMNVSAGGNIGERLMAVGQRHYGSIRESAEHWLRRVEIDADGSTITPTAYSGGMRQRLQIARNLVTNPRLVFMDEPTGGLDVSVQARLLDLIRGLVADYRLAVVIVTHDLAVARLLSHRMIVMKGGLVVESGLTDRVSMIRKRPTRSFSFPRCWPHDHEGNRARPSVRDLAKGFTLHLHGGKRLPVVSDVSFDLHEGECLVLGGPSGAGKSSVLKILYGNYAAGGGSLLVGIATPCWIWPAPRRARSLRSAARPWAM